MFVVHVAKSVCQMTVLVIVLTAVYSVMNVSNGFISLVCLSLVIPSAIGYVRSVKICKDVLNVHM